MFFVDALVCTLLFDLDMITEDYVSYETAKLLKEKGFDELCRSYWSDNHSLSFEHTKWFVANDNDCVYLLRPTLQMAMKWLREKYDLHIIVYPWEVVGEGKDSKHWCCQVYKSFNQLSCSKYTNETVKSYEEACEVAIKYCLKNLI